jgi:hypothetical protein
LVFSVGADHDSVTLSAVVVVPEEPEPLVPPLDEPLELDVEVTGEATGVEATGVVATGEDAPGVEAIGVPPVPVVESVPVLAGGVTAAALLASLAEPALCDEPPHPDSRTTEINNAPSIWVKKPQRRSIFMCIRLANG